MAQRFLYPPIWVLSISIAFIGMVALVGIGIGVWNLQNAAEQAAKSEAGKARAEAVLESQCRIIELNLVQPGDPRPTTARGIDLAAKYRAEWERLGCQ
jgi:hypothetical protein